MHDRPSQYLDLHLHVQAGSVRLEGTGKRENPTDDFDYASLFEEAALLDQEVLTALEGGCDDPAERLRELSKRVGALGLAIGDKLGSVGRELAVYARLPHVRLWIHADDEAAFLPWEALSVRPGNLGTPAMARAGELRGWQVLRHRPRQTLQEPRFANELRRLVIVVGDVRPDADITELSHATGALRERRETWTEVFATIAAIQQLAPPSLLREIHVCRAAYNSAEARWSALRAVPFTGPGDLRIRNEAKAEPTLVVVFGHTCEDRDTPARETALRSGPTSLLLDRDERDLTRRSLPVVAIAAHGRKTLAELLPQDVRLLMFLGCRTGDGFAAELPAVDHVVGLRTYVPFELATRVARSVLGALFRRGSAGIGEAVRLARRDLGLLGPDADPTGSLAPLWWAPAHWPALLDDEPFLDGTAQLLAEYRRRLAPRLEGLEGKMGRPSRVLAQVAVALHVGRSLGTEDAHLSQRAKEFLGHQPNLLDLVSEPAAVGASSLRRARPAAWVVHGDPGSGKSTSTRDLARQLTDGSLGLIPIFVSFAHWRATTNACTTLADLVAYSASFVDLHFAHAGEEVERNRELQRALVAHADRLVVILDGLDEVGDKRGAAKDLLENLRTSLPKAALLVTTRPADYLPLNRYEEARLQPLSFDQMGDLLYRWYLGTLEEAVAKKRAEDDLATIWAKDHALRVLAQTPLFLNLMAQLLLSGGELAATRRHEFLEQMLTWMLEGKHRAQATPFKREGEPDTDGTRAILRGIAFRLSSLGVTSIACQELLDWLELEAPEPIRDASEWGAAAFLRSARSNGLLGPALALRDPTPDQERRVEWRFHHRAFQEDLTAEELWQSARRATTLEPLLARVKGLIADARSAERRGPAGNEQPLEYWREPCALLAGYLGNRGSDWIDALLADPTTRSVGLAAIATAGGLAEDVLRRALAGCESWEETRLVYEPLGARLGRGPDAVGVLRERGRLLTDRMRAQKTFDRAVRIELHFLVECLDGIEERAPDSGAAVARGEILDAIGTPDRAELLAMFSTVPGKPDEGLWADVTGDTFLMGSPETERGHHHDETQAKITVSDFRIARTPVTLGQYQLFDRWKGHRWGDNPLLPVTEVTHFEATLFCRWLVHHGASLKPPNRRDWSFQLPTEAQWEYACRDRGLAMTRFVNGDSDEELKRVAVFGKKWTEGPEPVASRDPSSVLVLWDMHGNVWEWCRDWYHERLREGVDPGGPPAGARRVQRGGSCGDGAGVCRSACRYRWHPAGGNDDSGFRVVLAPRAPRW